MCRFTSTDLLFVLLFLHGRLVIRRHFFDPEIVGSRRRPGGAGRPLVFLMHISSV